MLFNKDSRTSRVITYNIKNDKYIICKDSVYFALTKEQVYEMKNVINKIILKIENNNE